MSEMLSLDLSCSMVGSGEISAWKDGLAAAKKKLRSGEEPFTGWVSLPFDYCKKELKDILAAAEKIRNQCEAFVVIGIGGSYLGAQAAISALRTEGTAGSDAAPEIYFAGQNLSGTYHKELLEKLRGKELCLCVISKSGTTTEPSVAFSILKDELYKKYGREEANRRIYAITDAEKGILREETIREGYTSFVVPDDVGGRYSVLTAVGLLPIAVAGIDVTAMLEGAAAAAAAAREPDTAGKTDSKPAGIAAAEALAATRISLLNRGKTIEVFEYYEPKLQFFAEWLKQLFGESEGKDGKGIFPAALQFSTDLHSMGQFLQEGNQIFFETVLNVLNPPGDLTVPESAGELLAGRSMNDINQAAVEGVIAAHEAVGVPIVRLDIPELTPHCFGQMVYFFETVCALSSYLNGVNPFDQPGVESYKAEMRKVLKAGGKK
ncbi:MAG TPA: glucose-6-phosphate isomerase [Anaerovoracaceae bacterium]|nr:glucose-6-phosphate isomerase [Anaerovoracaceae bacterium]